MPTRLATLLLLTALAGCASGDNGDRRARRRCPDASAATASVSSCPVLAIEREAAPLLGSRPAGASPDVSPSPSETDAT